LPAGPSTDSSRNAIRIPDYIQKESGNSAGVGKGQEAGEGRGACQTLSLGAYAKVIPSSVELHASFRSHTAELSTMSIPFAMCLPVDIRPSIPNDSARQFECIRKTSRDFASVSAGRLLAARPVRGIPQIDSIP
jgi:hypothetical protein